MEIVYIQKTLARIAKYEEYYTYGDEKCYIAQLAGNYSLSKETREYLFYKYTDDEVILNKLNNPSLYHSHPDLKIETQSHKFK